jgi:hypothetical protein
MTDRQVARVDPSYLHGIRAAMTARGAPRVHPSDLHAPPALRFAFA